MIGTDSENSAENEYAYQFDSLALDEQVNNLKCFRFRLPPGYKQRSLCHCCPDFLLALVPAIVGHPIRPVPPAFVPGPARYPIRHSVALELLPLSQLGRKLEWIGYEAVYEAKLKDDVWEFLAKRGGDLEVITLDSYTGRLLSREPLRPAPEMPFATVVNRLEKEGYTTISEVEFEDGVWEIEATKDGETHELVVELVSGRMEIRTAD